MSSVSTILVEHSTLFREGLSKLLARTGFIVTTMVASADEIDTDNAPEPELIIIGTGDTDNGMEKNIRALKARFPNSRLVVLADQYNADEVHTAFRLSARGYLMKTISCSTLVKSLELVMLGESIFPSAILTRMADEQGLDIEVDDEIVTEVAPISHSSRSLSTREMQILQCLVRGQSNKMIARNLDIVEATVKVHIKAILRKIHVQNRTQAAIWAVNRLDPPPAVLEDHSALGRHSSAAYKATRLHMAP